MNILIHNATIVTMQNRKVIREGAVTIEGSIIVDVGKTRELRPNTREDTIRQMQKAKLSYQVSLTRTNMLP
jgi:cytosine/adenosine deaminase-related metal-dependent hydrolase